MSRWSPRSKYNAKSTEVDGIKFPSRLEAGVYNQLKVLQREGHFKFFLRQPSFDLPGASKHRIDFAVFYEDKVKFIESKGRDLPEGKLRRKQVEDLYDITIHVVKKVSELQGVVQEV